MEEWRNTDVPDIEASNHGRIRRTSTGYIFNPIVRLGDYKRISNKGKKYRIHGLVARAWIPNPENLPQVNHKDGNKINNHVSNLEWITCSNNVLEAVRAGRKDGKSAATPIKVTINNESHTFISILEASKFLNISPKAVSTRILNPEKYEIKIEKIVVLPCEGIEERPITIRGYEHLIACSNGVLINKKHRKIITGSLYGGYFRIKPLNHAKKELPMTSVHQLIARTFIPNPDNKPYVNHIDGNKINNAISNLEWVTPQENTQHASRIGLLKKKVL